MNKNTLKKRLDYRELIDFPIESIKNEYNHLGEPHGWWITYLDNNKIEIDVAHYINGKANGLSFLTYEDGTIMGYHYYKDGVLHGLEKSFHENGVPQYEGYYVNGERDGIVKYFYDNGNLESIKYFEKSHLKHEILYGYTRSKMLCRNFIF